MLIGLLLGIAGPAYAGEPPTRTVRETGRVTLRGWPVVWEDQEPNEMAFTNNVWQAVMDGNWNTTSNWTLGVVPGATHVVIFDGTSQHDVTTGLNQSAAPFEHLYVTPKYSGHIGSQGAPLRTGIATGFIVWRGSGQGFINPDVGGFANVVCDVAHGFQQNRYDLVIGGMGVGEASTIAQLGIKRGNCNVMGDVNFTAQTYMLGDAARLVIDPNLDGMTEPKHIFCEAGPLINHRPLQADMLLVVGDRSRVTQIGALLGAPNPNHVLISGNGRFEYLPTSAPGTSPLISINGGVYDQTREKWNNVWGTTVIGPDGTVKGGPIKGTNFFPASADMRDLYPGAQE